MVTLIGTLVIVLLAVGWLGYTLRWNVRSQRLEQPLRAEIRSRPTTFRARVRLQDYRSPVSLRVHGDAFEIADTLPVTRIINGTDYCYRAPDTTLQMVHGLAHDWIQVQGQPGSGAQAIRIGDRTMNRPLWDALLSAGAHPIGPPPHR